MMAIGLASSGREVPFHNAAASMHVGHLRFRSIQPSDRDFLYEVYTSTRKDEMSVLDWDSTEKEAFLELQFNAQHRYYQEKFSNASFHIVLLDGVPIGRLYLDRRTDEIRIIDIALLMAHRNRGIGSNLMEAILIEAQAADLPVRIHVEMNNPALHLYKRLGFFQVSESGLYQLMEWKPEVSGAG